MQNEQLEFDKRVQEHDVEDFKNHTRTSLKLTPYEFHKIQTWDGFICKENGEYIYKGHKIEVISPATEEEIIDKIIQLGEIYPASKEELKEAINNAE